MERKQPGSESTKERIIQQKLDPKRFVCFQVRRSQLKILRSALRAWQLAVDEERARKMLLRKALARIRKGLLARCFAHWRAQQQHENKIGRLGQSVMAVLGKKKLRNVW